MTATLRDVLRAFETADRPRTLKHLARELDITPGLLDSMIQHWVRKGKLRPIHAGTACTTCGSAGQCAFITPLPPTYALVTDDMPLSHPPACARCD